MINFLDLFSQAGYIATSKQLARLVGLNAAALYGQLAAKFNYYYDEDKLLERDGIKWFYYTAEDAEEDTTLSRRKQDAAIKKLKEERLIVSKVFKNNQGDAVRYFSITSKIIELLQTPKGIILSENGVIADGENRGEKGIVQNVQSQQPQGIGQDESIHSDVGIVQNGQSGLYKTDNPDCTKTPFLLIDNKQKKETGIKNNNNNNNYPSSHDEVNSKDQTQTPYAGNRHINVIEIWNQVLQTSANEGKTISADEQDRIITDTLAAYENGEIHPNALKNYLLKCVRTQYKKDERKQQQAAKENIGGGGSGKKKPVRSGKQPVRKEDLAESILQQEEEQRRKQDTPQPTAEQIDLEEERRRLEEELKIYQRPKHLDAQTSI